MNKGRGSRGRVKDLKSNEFQGFVLYEAIIALIVLALITTPFINVFIGNDTLTYDRFEIDRLLEENLDRSLPTPENIPSEMTVSSNHRTSLVIHFEKNITPFRTCIKAFVVDSIHKREITHLWKCSYGAN